MELVKVKSWHWIITCLEPNLELEQHNFAPAMPQINKVCLLLYLPLSRLYLNYNEITSKNSTKSELGSIYILIYLKDHYFLPKKQHSLMYAILRFVFHDKKLQYYFLYNAKILWWGPFVGTKFHPWALLCEHVQK